ncbi:Mannosylfructose-phosphate synthase [Planctomycetes bacterium Pla163]|uniref:Mannosylfructose-phosphate synthase n=1 Tax=Rohdeia mirabilis TaxID=2528008 RepID=A0A518CYU0_9BACT|nr:Mannosylfructose-phosphate synthase [Planctomycetes bacterium Pla163]
MRVCFVVHGLPPVERGGVEQCTVALADELARRGHAVEVFAPTRRADLPDRALRRERRGAWHVTWVNLESSPGDPETALEPRGVAEAFARFLDAERPDVVHVQHLLRLGLGPLAAAAEFGAPLVYTAHDWFALTDSFALLRPDLTRFEAAPTPEEEARCDLARSILNAVESLGDYHLGVPAAWLDEPVRARVAATLAGDEEGAGFHENEWTEARARRERMASRRRAAFGAVDAFVSPSAYLAGWLEEAFVTGAQSDTQDPSNGGRTRPPRVVHQPNGIDTRRLDDVPAVPVHSAGAATERVRLGFVGSLTKHKGVHLLLDAYAQLSDATRERLPLVIHGDSTDRAYVARIADRARELGVEYAGAFDGDRLPEVLAGIDCLVVPSIWYENFPTVLREAFAAGRIAVASDLGALPESVRDGVDGLLYAPDDADDLARVLRRLVEEEGLLARLLEGRPRVRTIETQVDELEALYGELLVGREAPVDPGGGLAHLAELGRRYRELEALPTRDLLASCTSRIADLAGVLGLDAARSPIERLAFGLGESSRSLEELRDRRDESGYLGQLLDERERRARWLDERLSGIERERDWLRDDRENLAQAVEFHETSTQALEKERDWLRQMQSDFERERNWLLSKQSDFQREREYLLSKQSDFQTERDWLKRKTAELDEERARLDATLHETRTAAEQERAWRDSMLSEIERERDWLRSEIRSREEERTWLANLVSDKEETLTYVWGLVEGKDSDLARLRSEIESCERVAAEVLVAFGHAPVELEPDVEVEGGGKLERMLGGLFDHGHALLAQLEALRDSQARAHAELHWRRGEMDGARLALARRTVSWLAYFAGFAKRVAAWELPGSGDGAVEDSANREVNP